MSLLSRNWGKDYGMTILMVNFLKSYHLIIDIYYTAQSWPRWPLEKKISGSRAIRTNDLWVTCSLLLSSWFKHLSKQKSPLNPFSPDFFLSFQTGEGRGRGWGMGGGCWFRLHRISGKKRSVLSKPHKSKHFYFFKLWQSWFFDVNRFYLEIRW